MPGLDLFAANKGLTFGLPKVQQFGSFNQLPPVNTQKASPGLTFGGGVLGASTQQNPQSQRPGGVTPDGSFSVGYNGPSQGPSIEDQMRGQIESGYSGYFNELDAMFGELPNQRAAQEGIVQNQYTQGVTDLDTQQTQGVADLESTRTKTTGAQAKTLKTIADDIQNQMLAGQVYLGARGAGDSSAANQYSYALTKMGNKQRGDVTAQYAGIQNDINDREFKLKSTVEGEKKKLDADRNSKLMEVAQWFSEAQNQIRQMKAEGQLGKGRDIASLSQQLLNTAIQRMQQAEQQVQQRSSMLEQWAIQKSNDIGSLRQNLSQVSSMSPSYPQANAIQGQPAMNPAAVNGGVVGYGYSQDDKLKGLFG